MVFVESTISAYKIYGYVIIKIIQHTMKPCAAGCLKPRGAYGTAHLR